MLSLARPGHTARATFTVCISRVSDPVLKARLDGVTQAVVDGSRAFNVAATRHALHTIASENLVGGDITVEEMGKVYTQRMAKTGAPGRDIYDEIIGSSRHNLCPLCAQRQVATLDHHLPKALYPALAVAPLNLVPSCTDCNKAKLSTRPRNESDVPLHPYYDDIDAEPWLSGRVIETRPSSVQFRVDAPDSWDDVLTARVKNHFRILRLASLYASESANELVNIRHQFTKMLATNGAGRVQEELEIRAASCAAGQRNGWRAATYRAWAESDWFCNGGFAS
jgi:hypothetical protein